MQVYYDQKRNTLLIFKGLIMTLWIALIICAKSVKIDAANEPSQYSETNNETLSAHIEPKERNTVKPGDNLTIDVKVENIPHETVSFIWEKDYYENGKVIHEKLDYNASELILCDIRKSTHYTITVISEDGGTVQKNVWIIIDNDLDVRPIDYLDTPIEDRRFITQGEMLWLEVKAFADDLDGIKYRWYTDRNPDVTLCEDCIYYTFPIDEPVCFYCTAEDKYGNYATATFIMEIDNALYAASISGLEEEDVFINADEPVRLEVIYQARNEDNITLTWFYNEYMLSEKGTVLELETAHNGDIVKCIVNDGTLIEKSVTFYIVEKSDDDKQLLGDLDNDGQITSFDALLILQFEAGVIETNELDFSVGDVDHDGIITSFDASIILEYEAGIINSLPLE